MEKLIKFVEAYIAQKREKLKELKSVMDKEAEEIAVFESLLSWITKGDLDETPGR